MTGWIVAAIVLGVGVLATIVVRVRARRAPDGIATFRRHMDALSSDSRRTVTERIKDAHDGPEG
jgi:type IV secretory pathway TrbD component